MKTFMSLVFALGTVAAVSGPASAENDNNRDTHNAKQFYKKLDSEKGN